MKKKIKESLSEINKDLIMGFWMNVYSYIIEKLDEN